jgi:hypothetical protein
MVGFFLASLVIHGGCQQWWIAPMLGHLSEWPLMIGATVLTTFNDNAAITYLASLVPGLSDSLKYAVGRGGNRRRVNRNRQCSKPCRPIHPGISF